MKPYSNGQDAHRVLPERDAAPFCGIPLSTWRKMRRRGETPPAIELSARRRGYTVASLIDWQRNRTTNRAKQKIEEITASMWDYADWRRLKSAEYPEELANVDAAESAEFLAMKLESLKRFEIGFIEANDGIEWNYDKLVAEHFARGV